MNHRILSLKIRALLVLSAFALSLGIVEYGARWGLAHSRSSHLGDPSAYFNPLCDEDYWRALRRGRFGADLHRVGPNDHDAKLGWVPAKNSLDTSGALSSPSNPGTTKTIALFGDSYIFGTTPPGTRISDVLSTLRPDTRVLNFGVGGYGLDQIILRVEDRAKTLSPGDHVVVGILTTDIDRAVLKVRDAPKPWFALQADGSLTLHLPPEGDVSTWFATHPVTAKSLLWSRLQRTLNLTASQGGECEMDTKKRLTHALLERLAKTCTQSQFSCRLLLLHRPTDIENGSDWRSSTIKRSSSLPVLDSSQWFLDETADWRRFYGSDRHPSTHGNALIAAGLDRSL